MATQIFCGVSGRSTWVTPSGASASITALAIAGVEPMVAASPMPLTPSVVRGESVRVWSLSQGAVEADVVDVAIAAGDELGVLDQLDRAADVLKCHAFASVTRWIDGVGRGGDRSVE